MKTIRLKKRKKQKLLSPIERVEIRAAIQARRHLSSKELAKRYRVSLMTIYRIERVMDFDRMSRASVG